MTHALDQQTAMIWATGFTAAVIMAGMVFDVRTRLTYVNPILATMVALAWNSGFQTMPIMDAHVHLGG